jgi:hypothetical protein
MTECEHCGAQMVPCQLTCPCEAERARIVTMARARAAQYMSDGYEQLADAVNNFAREIER